MATSLSGSCPDDGALAALMAGRLPSSRREGLLAHADGCVRCFDLLEALSGDGVHDSRPPPRSRAEPRYVAERELGRGAMGIVHGGRDTLLDRPVALKRIRPERLAVPVMAARFREEARLLAAIRHRNVVAVLDLLEEGDGSLTLVTELIAGTHLRAWSERPRTDAAKLQILRDITAALDAVHGAGITHRDVKPENVLVDHDGRAVLGDFGLATLDPVRGTTGTRPYLAPEQLAGAPASPETDRYAFAVMAAELLLGGHPLAPGSPARARLARPRDALSRVLARALSPQPAERPRTLAAFLADLTGALPTSGTQRREALVVAAVTTLVAAFVLLWVLSTAFARPVLPDLGRARGAASSVATTVTPAVAAPASAAAPRVAAVASGPPVDVASALATGHDPAVAPADPRHPPSVDDWQRAPERAPAASHARRCELKAHGGWVRLSCRTAPADPDPVVGVRFARPRLARDGYFRFTRRGVASVVFPASRPATVTVSFRSTAVTLAWNGATGTYR